MTVTLPPCVPLPPLAVMLLNCASPPRASSRMLPLVPPWETKVPLPPMPPFASTTSAPPRAVSVEYASMSAPASSVSSRTLRPSIALSIRTPPPVV